MTTDYDTPDLAEVIDDALTSRLLDVHVALPGKVLSYDVAKQTAQIELGVHRVLETDEGAPVPEPLPVLENVPVAFPRIAGGFLSFPIAAGDAGLVVFCESSIDQWRSKGTPTSPGDRRRHSLTAGVFFPGLAPNAQALTDPGLDSSIALGDVGGAQVRVGSGLVQATSGGAASAADFVALAAKVSDELQALSDRVAIFEAAFSAWTVSAGDGGLALKSAHTAAVGTGAPGPPPGSVASSNLKADG